MSTIIYYFTGTGNSLYCARRIGDLLGDTTLVPIEGEGEKIAPLRADNIGLVFPVYAFGLPGVVKQFIKHLSPDNKGKYFFTVATNGGRVAGTLVLTRRMLGTKGIKLSAGYSVIMPTNMILLHETNEEKKKILFDSMEKKVREIVSAVKFHEYHAVETGTMSDRILRTGMLYRSALPFIKKMDHKFKADQGCIGCGLCSQVCPVHNIEIKNGIPSWNHQCEMCLSCLNLCPRHAVQYGNMSEGKQRYKNPYVEVKDLMRR